MDDEDFEDLFGGGNVLEDSSQESLTNAAANLAFYESDDEKRMHGRQTSPATSLGSEDDEHSERKLARAATLTPGVGEQPDERDPPISAGSPPLSLQVQSRSVISKIEEVFEQIADGMISKHNEICLTLKVRSKPTTATAVTQGHDVSHQAEARSRRVCFPGKSAEEAWRFTVVIRILELVHEALRSGVTLSKRDIYYRDPALFGSQAHVDRYVDDIAFTFGIPRSALNVAAMAKGLVAGAFTFCRRDGSVVNAAADRDGILVPSLKEVLSVDMTAVRWIVVIEKEASFRSIASSSFWETLSTQGILVTGKGYPDIATRALLRFLSTSSPQNGFTTPPVYGLVDFDPDGLAILSTYKYGSITLAHESAELRVPQLKWLGLRSEHMLLGGDNTHSSQGLLTLTARDRGKARNMLERSALHGDADSDGADDADQAYARELQVMLMLNMKAELQLLDAVPNGMTDLLDGALGQL
ncbi:hypothetical protein LTR36_004372 [Oleoguttula mirabilis]|uniref:DNA topoisomerase (ATP-hydrolyzing) n=1 Tax=Oleoguttula mirabilis TaxID=1507867 RepID=A0AAV9JH54_9PEZI|nr:hypothetical protein LTR36_004372 [Oleoguttula mirabilis]